MGVSGSTDSGGTASVFLEKSQMLRVARGTCPRGGHGRRPARWGCDQRCSSEVSKFKNKQLPAIAGAPKKA